MDKYEKARWLAERASKKKKPKKETSKEATKTPVKSKALEE